MSTATSIDPKMPPASKPFGHRLWQYCQERFPPAKHGLLIAAFAAAGMSLSSTLRGAPALPSLASYAVIALSTITLFLMLRIADEFKDHHDDCRWRPYLPVPRGLISLPELAVVFAVCPAVQLALNLWLAPQLCLILAAIWAYIFLMSKEFFARQWLRRHPVAYLLSHMLIVPLVDIYITAGDWLVQGGTAPNLLWMFILLSFLNGVILEVGRKIRSPQEEEPGVETYSFLWGARRATCIWLTAIISAAIMVLLLAGNIVNIASAAAAVVMALLAFTAGGLFLSRKKGAIIEHASGIYVLVLYLSIGFLPLVGR